MRNEESARPFILWLTGLSGSGKSTLAHGLKDEFDRMGVKSFLLDGDVLREGLNSGLGFSPEDRTENIRRAGEVSKLFVKSGCTVVASFISPYRKDRAFVRNLVNEDEFIEVYVKCSLRACEARDEKGLYKKAREGIISDFTGISAPYEEPQNPEIIVETEKTDLQECVRQIIRYIEKMNKNHNFHNIMVINKLRL